MTFRPWKVAAAATAVTAVLLGGAQLAAQNAAAHHAGRLGLMRRPAALNQAPLTPQQRISRSVSAQATFKGLLVVFEYNPNLSKALDLDDNGSTLDNGDRTLRQGTIWLSNRSGDKLRRIGEFAAIFDYLDVSGENSGTDITQAVDMFFTGSGQIRAAGFWNVDDGVGSPSLGITGATGTSLKQYRQGQLIYLDALSDNDELYLLAK